jgi:hypothetical protein
LLGQEREVAGSSPLAALVLVDIPPVIVIVAIAGGIVLVVIVVVAVAITVVVRVDALVVVTVAIDLVVEREKLVLSSVRKSGRRRSDKRSGLNWTGQNKKRGGKNDIRHDDLHG